MRREISSVAESRFGWNNSSKCNIYREKRKS
nr:MAG TPA: hypothetical protein [Caudoviricetes sp.]